MIARLLFSDPLLLFLCDFASLREIPPMSENRLSRIIVDSAYKIHTTLGPGLLESVYDAVLAHELKLRGLSITKQQAIPVIYEGVQQRKSAAIRDELRFFRLGLLRF